MTSSEQQQIEVDLLALQQSRDQIATEINDLLHSGLSSARGLIYRGLPVGERSESLEVQMSRQAITYAMKCFSENSEAYVDRAKQMTQFLATILEDYKDADDFAKLKLETVIQRLDEIRNAVPPTPTPTPTPGGGVFE